MTKTCFPQYLGVPGCKNMVRLDYVKITRFKPLDIRESTRFETSLKKILAKNDKKHFFLNIWVSLVAKIWLG